MCLGRGKPVSRSRSCVSFVRLSRTFVSLFVCLFLSFFLSFLPPNFVSFRFAIQIPSISGYIFRPTEGEYRAVFFPPNVNFSPRNFQCARTWIGFITFRFESVCASVKGYVFQCEFIEIYVRILRISKTRATRPTSRNEFFTLLCAR